MPTATNGHATAFASAPTGKNFELPSLTFNFGSLTEGTDIPPPAPSPIAEAKVPEPPQTPNTAVPSSKPPPAAVAAAALASEHAANTNGDGIHASPRSDVTSTAGVKRPAEDVPVSPTSSNRQGSIRRLFSKNLLHTSYANGEVQASHTSENGYLRPDSRSNDSVATTDKKAKRGSWFRRLRSSNDNKRSSMILDEPPVILKPKQPAGPPPPTIPELSALKTKLDVTDGGSLGSDLFKNIK